MIKAGLGHLWFWLVTLHPFDDGNERIARAIGDLLLARANGNPQRFYSLSAQMQRPTMKFWNAPRRGGWMSRSGCCGSWTALQRARDQARQTLDAALLKTRYWQRWATLALNARQVKMLNRLLDGSDGKLNNSKWAAIARCSPDAALRDINDLLARGVLRKMGAGGG